MFSGSFILEAAETICAGPDLPGDRVLTLLGRLVDKSLINVVPSAQHTGLVTRYRFLDTIHSFGRRKLEEANETGWMHRTHASYYVRLVENAEPELFLPDQGRWFMLLKAEYDNLRAAMQWTVAVGEAEAALRLVGALIWFWFFYGSWRDGLELSMNALSVPTIPHLGSLRARALNTAGVLHWFLGDAVTARVLLDEAVRLAQQFNDDMNLALSLQMRGLVFISEGEYQLGDSAMKEGLALAKKLEDDKSMFFALAFQGDIVLERGDRAKAQEIYAESIRLLRSFGDKYFLGYPLRRLGYLALGQDQFGAAWHYFHDSLTLNREIGDQRAVTACLLSMASLALQIDQPEMAVVLFGVVDTRIESLTTNLMLLDQVKVGMVREQIQARLGKERFVSGLNEGAELSEEQLMALVNVLEGAVMDQEKRV